MTAAEGIANRFNNDGQCWRDSSGVRIYDIVQANAASVCGVLRGNVGDSERFEFADGSAIVITGGGWDMGYPAPCACHCWISQPHHCEEE